MCDSCSCSMCISIYCPYELLFSAIFFFRRNYKIMWLRRRWLQTQSIWWFLVYFFFILFCVADAKYVYLFPYIESKLTICQSACISFFYRVPRKYFTFIDDRIFRIQIKLNRICVYAVSTVYTILLKIVSTFFGCIAAAISKTIKFRRIPHDVVYKIWLNKYVRDASHTLCV